MDEDEMEEDFVMEEGDSDNDNFDFSSEGEEFGQASLTGSFGEAIPATNPSSSSSSSFAFSRDSRYAVLGERDIRRKCEEMIGELSEIGSLSSSESALVLRHLKWNMEKVIDLLTDNREEILKKVCWGRLLFFLGVRESERENWCQKMI